MIQETRIPRSTAVRRGAVEAPRTRRRAAAETEQVLLTAARSAFERKGYIRTTVDDITEGTGLSRGAFYRYFRNTDAVFVRIVTERLDHLLVTSAARPPGTAPTLRERVEFGNRNFLLAYETDRLLFRSLYEADQVNADIASLHAQLRGLFVLRIRNHLRRQTELGRCKPFDLDTTSFALAMMVEGVAHAWLAAGVQPFEEPIQREVMLSQLTELWCRNVYLDADQPLPVSRPETAENHLSAASGP